MTIVKSSNIQARHPLPSLWQRILLIAIILGLSWGYFAALKSVPFHPDESTQIFMSQDLDSFFQNPSQLFWHADHEGDARQRYRLIDAPITRYLIGAGLKISGQDKPVFDWDWSLNWHENKKNGSLPQMDQLVAARFSVAFLFPFSVLLLYLIGRELGGKWTGWLGCFLFGLNALVLIHTRRAMAESALLFSELLMIFFLMKTPSNPWLLAVGAALAFNSKQSTFPLFLVGLFSLFFFDFKGGNWFKRLWKSTTYGILFILITFFLNPVFWSHPIFALQDSIHLRRDLIAQQTEDFKNSSAQVLETPIERAAGLIGNLYIVPPQSAETGNYIQELQSPSENYFSNPVNNLFRGFVAGGFLLFASLIGFMLSLRKAVKERMTITSPVVLLCLGGLSLALAILSMLPVAFQRYVVPLVPFVCLYSAFALDQLLFNKKTPG